VPGVHFRLLCPSLHSPILPPPPHQLRQLRLVAGEFAVVDVADDAAAVDDERARQALAVAGRLALAVAARGGARAGTDGVGGQHAHQVAPLDAEGRVQRRLFVRQAIDVGGQPVAELARVLRLPQAQGDNAQPGGFNFFSVQL